jgi:hypothetical protein
VAEAVRYVEHQSLWLDLRVLARTACCVLLYSCFSPARRPLPEPPRAQPECGAAE